MTKSNFLKISYDVISVTSFSGRPHYLVQKNFGIFEIYVVYARTKRKGD